MRNVRWLLLIASIAAFGCSELDRTHVRAWIGDAETQFKLGVMYESGDGVSKDEVEAARWLRKAAEQGLPKAQYTLALMYNVGRGVPYDDAEALRWYRKAAEQGEDAAQFRLGWRYQYGGGVPKDDVQAHVWLNLSRAAGNESAHSELPKLELKMTAEQIGSAQKLAREWHEQHRQREGEGNR